MDNKRLKLLDILMDELPDDTPWQGNIKGLLEGLISRGVTVQEWIPVTERLPTEADGTVLVCFPDVNPYNIKEPFPNAKHDQRVRTGKYSQHSNTWYIGEFNAVGGPDPVFWMPLPEPAKKER